MTVLARSLVNTRSHALHASFVHCPVYCTVVAPLLWTVASDQVKLPSQFKTVVTVVCTWVTAPLQRLIFSPMHIRWQSLHFLIKLDSHRNSKLPICYILPVSNDCPQSVPRRVSFRYSWIVAHPNRVNTVAMGVSINALFYSKLGGQVQGRRGFVQQ